MTALWPRETAVDRFAADQLIALAALPRGTSRVRIASVTDHITTGLVAGRNLPRRVRPT